MAIDAKELRIFGLVYKITCLINNKVYLGITRKSIKERWNEHKHNSVRKKKKAHLNSAILKYGIKNFIIEKIKTCYSSEQLYKAEKFFIKLYGSTDSKLGYNNSIGGEISRLGSTHSLETKNKISNYQKKRKRIPHSLETRNKIRQLSYGRDMSAAVIVSAKKRRGLPAHNRKSVSQYTIDGNFIKKHTSFKNAALYVKGVPQAFQRLRDGKLKTYKSFLWQF